MIQRIYIKAGEGQQRRELPVLHASHGLTAGSVPPSHGRESKGGDPSIHCARPSLGVFPVSGPVGPAWVLPHLSLRGLETGSRIARAETYVSLSIFVLFRSGGRGPCKAPSQAGEGPKCHHSSRDYSVSSIERRKFWNVAPESCVILRPSTLTSLKMSPHCFDYFLIFIFQSFIHLEFSPRWLPSCLHPIYWTFIFYLQILNLF